MIPIKIAVGGAHSTGKTTFLRRLAEALRSRGLGCRVVTDLAIRCPLPILREHTIESTLWIVASGIAEEIAAAHHSKVVLVDRPVVDAWAYLLTATAASFPDAPGPALNTLESAIKNWLPTYQLVYRTILDKTIPIENNKGRDLDPEYRAKVARQMDGAYVKFDVQERQLTAANTDSELDYAVTRVAAIVCTDLR